MGIKRKVFVSATTMAAIVVPISASATTSFVDVKEKDYFAEAIQSLTERGVIKGYSADNTFRPYKEVTRGQAAKMIAGALGYDIQNVQNPHFKDVPKSHEFYGAIAALANHGIINGYTSTQAFKPDAPMTRHQMAKVIALAFGLQASTAEVPFTDVAKDYAKYVAALYEHDITTGTSAKMFGGNTNVKRGQLAAFIYRAENAEIPTEKEEVNILSGTITNVSTGTVEIDGDTYNVPAALLGFVNNENSPALKGASIQGTLKGGEIVSIDSLTIKAQSTQESPVILKGIETPVASLKPVATLVEIDTKITIDTPYVMVKNLKLNELVMTPKVQDIQLNLTLDKLLLEKDTTAKIHGEVSIGEVQVNTEKAVELALKGIISKIDVRVAKASIKLGQEIQIKDVVTNGGEISSIISNYQSVQGQISKVNGVPLSTSKPSDTSTEGGNVIIPSNPAPLTVKGIISVATSESVTINGRVYKIDSSLSRLFSSEAMEGAEITVNIKNDTIVEVTALKVKTAGSLEGNGAMINGTLTIDTDGLLVSNLAIVGDVKLTERVQTSIDFNKVDITGSLIAEETKTAELRSMRVASLGALMAAENPVTRLKITFSNSTVAFVQIKKVDTELSIHGATEISVLSLESNGSIFADPQVILPNLKISKGVTHIELNASIAAVEIDTNDDIEITGKGNFNSVKVKTDKTVALKTEGTIKELASNTANIQLGTNLKVQDTKTLTGEVKPAKELITNYDEVKENVNVPIKEEDLNDYLAAKILPVKNRYGYATLSVINADKYTVKYRLVPRHVEVALLKAKEKAPADAIVYKEGDQFIPWFLNDIQVYLVDQNDIIVDAYEIPSTWGLELGTYKIENGKIVFKTIFSPEAMNIEYISFVNDTQFFMPENFSSYNWKLDEDNIPTIEIPLPENFVFNADKYNFLDIYLRDNNLSGAFWRINKEFNSEIDKSYLEALYQLTQHYSKKEQEEFWWGINRSLYMLLSYYAHDSQPIHDLNGNIISYDYIPLLKEINIVMDQYVEKLKARRFTSGEEIKAMVLDVNKANEALITQVTEAIKAVNSLFKEDYHEYEYLNKLAEKTGIEEINAAEALVNALPEEYDRKQIYLSLIHYAKNILADKSKSTAKVMNVTVGDTSANKELIINTKDLIFEEDASVLYHGMDTFKYEGKDQLQGKLESLGYKVTSSDSSLIVSELTSPDTIKVITGTMINSVVSGDTLIIDTTQLKAASYIGLENPSKTYTQEGFLQALRARFADANIREDEIEGLIFVSKDGFKEEDILHFTMGLYNVQEVVLSFSEAIQIGNELELMVQTIEGNHAPVISTATVSGNNVKIIIKTPSGYTPRAITVKGLLDQEGKVVVVENEEITKN